MRVKPAQAAALLIAAGAVAVMAAQAHGSRVFGLDFSQMRGAALNLLHHGDPYLRSRNQPFVYPPFAAVVSLPLVAVSAVVADDVGLLLVTASLIVLAFASARLARRGPVFGAVVLIVVALSGVGRLTLALVTLSAVVAALLAVSLVLSADERWIEAAVVFGVAAAVKPLVAPAVLMFAVARKWRPLAVAVALPLAVNLLTVPLLDHPAHFVTSTLPAVLRGQTLRSVYSVSISAVASDRIAVVALKVLVVLVVLAVLVGSVRRSGRMDLAAVAASSILAVALVGRVDESHYALVAVPLLAVAVNLSRARLVALLAALALALPGSVVPGTSHLGRWWSLVGQILVLVTALVVAWQPSSGAAYVVEQAE